MKTANTIHLSVALALLVPTRAWAEPEPTTVAVEASADDGDAALRVEAERLYEDGLALYNTFDYEGAIAVWTQAYGKLSASEANAGARNALVYNIAGAQEKAYEQDHDVVHLVRAKALLELYVQENLEAGGADAADLAKARERISAFDERIAAAQKKQQTPQTKPNTTPTPKPVDESPERRPGVGLVAGGATLLVLGAATVIGGVTAGVLTSQRAGDRIAGLDALGDEAERRRQLARGQRGDTIMIATAATGGAAVLAGVVMLAVGATRMRKQPRIVPRAAFTPWLGRDRIGVGWSIGF